jgi:hypothetical protein
MEIEIERGLHPGLARCDYRASVRGNGPAMIAKPSSFQGLDLAQGGAGVRR